MKKRFPDIVYNSVSLIGAIIALIAAELIFFLTVIEFFARNQKPYMGIVTFIILPGILIFGLLLIAYGIFREYKKKKAGKATGKQLPIIDLNNPRQRTAVTFFAFGTVILLAASAVGSFKAYEYTDSDEFCGTLCHTVMKPEYTAYKHSPHSKVGCVQCHIGSGAGWFVRSKISGSYQVYSVLFNKYSRPIPTPIENLRPAQETCEQCHWPKHFYSEKLVKVNHFLPDENNTRSGISMLLKVGGGNSQTGNTYGIHWQMNIANDVWYYASDESRQTIPYVKFINKETKKVKEFITDGFTLTPDKEKQLRKMDCIDCHNRPSHIYNPPDKMINLSMSNGTIDTSLPYMKSMAVQVLEEKYLNTGEAMSRIPVLIKDFYSNHYPELLRQKSSDIDKSIDAIKNIYANNYFPEMNVSWKQFPNNLGHTYSDGCFRCHDNKHFDKEKKSITNDCNSCHTILEQYTPESGSQVSMKGLAYAHPGGLTGNIRNQKCSDCHSHTK
ncbi:MAG: NapC/NirT family cytochrome c [Ignavibacteria bacterium]|nr:NapC/NirT family cytochrome c [Ignavibacteria bacterium]